MKKYIIYIGVVLTLFFVSCKEEKKSKKNIGAKSEVGKTEEKVNIPKFNSDSAFFYVKKQTEFGPRVPNSDAHKECGDYLVEFFKDKNAKVIEQKFKVRTYNNKVLDARNIIASYNLEVKNRVILCAHWDSRPYADWDSNEENHYKPIDGANDGASGVGVLMEIARQLEGADKKIGVDIILFDAEDYGEHKLNRSSNNTNTWALGSQYWAKNPHKAGYKASYGILLDMVGAKNPQFTKENYSMMYAPNIVNGVWKTAQMLGYSNYFLNIERGDIIDDHYYINKIAGIPTINIIHTSNTRTGFFEHWHTVNDNIENIDPFTLEIVGNTVLHYIFSK